MEQALGEVLAGIAADAEDDDDADDDGAQPDGEAPDLFENLWAHVKSLEEGESDIEGSAEIDAGEQTAEQSDPAGAANSPRTSDISISSFEQDPESGEDAPAEACGLPSGDAGSSSSSSGGSAVPARRELQGPRRAGVPELRFHVADYGEIRFNTVSQYYRAICAQHDQCARQRTCAASDKIARRGQGRPLGLLAAWLLDQSHSSSRDHVRAPVPTLSERQAGRNFLKSLCSGSEYEDFAQHERVRAGGEPEEPARVP